MIAPEDLQGFDLLLWLGSGRLAAAENGCSQPTISRQAREVAQQLRLSLHKEGRQWQVRGDTTLLAFERQLHQLHRFLGRAPLRLEIGAVSGRLLGLPAPRGWIVGPADRLNPHRSLELLSHRVIDAWITTAADDLPDPPGQDCCRFDLYQTPLWLVAAADHPLAGVKRLGDGDLHPFPSAGLRGGWFPRSEAHLRQRGLWSAPLALERYDRRRWDGRTADRRTLAYASAPMLALNPALRRLDYDLGLTARSAVLVHRDHAQAGATALLLAELRRRTLALAPLHPPLQPCGSEKAAGAGS